jgi:hypothetical protein
MTLNDIINICVKGVVISGVTGGVYYVLKYIKNNNNNKNTDDNNNTDSSPVSDKIVKFVIDKKEDIIRNVIYGIFYGGLTFILSPIIISKTIYDFIQNNKENKTTIMLTCLSIITGSVCFILNHYKSVLKNTDTDSSQCIDKIVNFITNNVNVSYGLTLTLTSIIVYKFRKNKFIQNYIKKIKENKITFILSCGLIVMIIITCFSSYKLHINKDLLNNYHLLMCQISYRLYNTDHCFNDYNNIKLYQYNYTDERYVCYGALTFILSHITIPKTIYYNFKQDNKEKIKENKTTIILIYAFLEVTGIACFTFYKHYNNNILLQHYEVIKQTYCKYSYVDNDYNYC